MLTYAAYIKHTLFCGQRQSSILISDLKIINFKMSMKIVQYVWEILNLWCQATSWVPYLVSQKVKPQFSQSDAITSHTDQTCALALQLKMIIQDK